jgi:hypothetical protein
MPGTAGAQRRTPMGNHHDEDWAADEVDVWLAARRRSWILPSVATLSLLAGVAGILAALTFKGRHDAVVSRMGDLERLQAKIDQVKAEQAARTADLDLLREQIAESQREQVKAERRARRAQCDATNAKLDAEILIRQASCYKEVADAYRCNAENEEARAHGTMLGTLLGAGLAIATGGGALLAVGGAALGSTGSDNRECPAVACTLDLAVIEGGVLEAHELSQRENCADADRT